MFLTESMIKRSSVKINQKTSNQHSLSFFWNSSWIFYLSWATTVYDISIGSTNISEYCYQTDNLLIFIWLNNDTVNDYLTSMLNTIDKNTWIITYTQFVDTTYLTEILSVKYENNHIYINTFDTTDDSYYYSDIDLSTLTQSSTTGTHTTWIDIDNTPVLYQWYKMRCSSGFHSVSWTEYIKNKIRIDYD